MPYDATIINEIVGRYEEHIKVFSTTNNVPLSKFTPLELDKHPIQLVSARMYNILAKGMNNFARAVGTAISSMERPPHDDARAKSSYDFSLSHMMCWDAEKESVIIFPNLPASTLGSLSGNGGYWHSNRSTRSDAENAFFPTNSTAIQDEIASDLADPFKNQKWLPVERGIRRLKKRQTTTVGRVISNYLLLRGVEPIKDKEWIETVASRVIASTRPPQLHWVSDKEGFRRMYTFNQGSPQSCMDSRKGHDRLYVDTYNTYKNNKVQAFMNNPQPVDWYGDNPEAFGAYIERAGIILARGVYYKNEQTGVSVATRVYGVTNEMHKLLVNHMRDSGINVSMTSSGSSIDKVKDLVYNMEDLTFELPTYKMGGVDVVPFPYFDWFPYRLMYAKTGTDKVTFVCTQKKLTKQGYAHVNLHDVKGYITNGDEGNRDEYYNCDECGEELHHEDMIWMDDDSHYCSDYCASCSGWAWYQTGMHSSWRSGYNLEGVRSFDLVSIFSNRVNALKYGSLVTITPWALPELDVESTYHHQFSHRNYMSSGHSDCREVSVRGSSSVRGASWTSIKRTVRLQKELYDVHIAVPSYCSPSLWQSNYNNSTSEGCEWAKVAVTDRNFMYNGLYMQSETITTVGHLSKMPMVKGVDTILNLCGDFYEPLHTYEQELDTMFEHLPTRGSEVTSFDNLRDTIKYNKGK